MPGPLLIGVALDDRDGEALALGTSLARLSGSPPVLVHAYPYEPLTVPTPEYEAALRSDALERLERLADGLRPEFDVAVHAYARLSAAYGLQEMAERLGAAGVVVGSSHRGTMGQVLLGTVATRLLHGAPCWVGVAPAGYSGPSRTPLRIGVAFDGRPESRAALEVAIALAGRSGTTVSAYTVEEPVTAAPSPVTAQWADMHDWEALMHRRAADRLAIAHDRIPKDRRGDVELLTGAPADALEGVSGELDLLVCGSRGYGPLRAVLLGGVSSALARHSRCPLLVVPRGHAGDLPGPGDPGFPAADAAVATDDTHGQVG